MEGDVVAVMPDEEQYTGQPWIAVSLSPDSGEHSGSEEPLQDHRWRYDPFDIDLTTIINTVEFTPTHRLTKSSQKHFSLKQTTLHGN